MPTFDFANVVRKLIAAAVSAAASPVTGVLAAASLLAIFLEDILTFFNDTIKLPSFSLPSIPSEYDSDFLRLIFYAIKFDLVKDFVNLVLSFISSCLAFGVKFIVSLLAVLVLVGVYRVIRKQLKDVVG